MLTRILNSICCPTLRAGICLFTLVGLCQAQDLDKASEHQLLGSITPSGSVATLGSPWLPAADATEPERNRNSGPRSSLSCSSRATRGLVKLAKLCAPLLLYWSCPESAVAAPALTTRVLYPSDPVNVSNIDLYVASLGGSVSGRIGGRPDAILAHVPASMSDSELDTSVGFQLYPPASDAPYTDPNSHGYFNRRGNAYGVGVPRRDYPTSTPPVGRQADWSRLRQEEQLYSAASQQIDRGRTLRAKRDFRQHCGHCEHADSDDDWDTVRAPSPALRAPSASPQPRPFDPSPYLEGRFAVVPVYVNLTCAGSTDQYHFGPGHVQNLQDRLGAVLDNLVTAAPGRLRLRFDLHDALVVQTIELSDCPDTEDASAWLSAWLPQAAGTIGCEEYDNNQNNAARLIGCQSVPMNWRPADLAWVTLWHTAFPFVSGVSGFNVQYTESAFLDARLANDEGPIMWNTLVLHEFSHAFGANEEYLTSDGYMDDCIIYTNSRYPIINGNSPRCFTAVPTPTAGPLPCVMQGSDAPDNSEALCRFTRGQFGWGRWSQPLPTANDVYPLGNVAIAHGRLGGSSTDYLVVASVGSPAAVQVQVTELSANGMPANKEIAEPELVTGAYASTPNHNVAVAVNSGNIYVLAQRIKSDGKGLSCELGLYGSDGDDVTEAWNYLAVDSYVASPCGATTSLASHNNALVAAYTLPNHSTTLRCYDPALTNQLCNWNFGSARVVPALASSGSFLYLLVQSADVNVARLLQVSDPCSTSSRRYTELNVGRSVDLGAQQYALVLDTLDTPMWTAFMYVTSSGLLQQASIVTGSDGSLRWAVSKTKVVLDDTTQGISAVVVNAEEGERQLYAAYADPRTSGDSLAIVRHALGNF